MHEMQPSTPFIIHPFSPGNTLLSIIENFIENSLHPKAYSNPEKDLNVMGSKSIHISFPIQQSTELIALAVRSKMEHGKAICGLNNNRKN